jgi:acetolactate synthase-1/2/3 large subunit
MKLSDYIIDFLYKRGITHAFGMSGGAAVHMFDSIDRHSEMEIISMTHEQCAAIAADGYARASGLVGVAICTSGPGATNLLTGTCCSFYDSIPTLMLTGQVSTHRLKGASRIRQLGFQETNVVSIFESITKFAAQLTDAKDIRYLLEKAFYIALEGRPGPVLLDIPDDLQRAEINPEKLIGFTPPNLTHFKMNAEEQIGKLLGMLGNSTRPVLVLGGGLKTPYVGSELLTVIDKLGIPVLVTWAALDLMPSNHPLMIGTFGVYGSRKGNLAIQNADLVITLGTRLSQNLTGGILSSFAREAKIVMVDADEHEMNKFDGKGIRIDLRINTLLSSFLMEIQVQLEKYSQPDIGVWLKKLNRWKNLFAQEPSPKAMVSWPYLDANDFVRNLSSRLSNKAVVYADTGGNLTWTCNSFIVKDSQKIFSAWNHTPMGYSLPAAIGAAFYDPENIVTCIIGDGGLMICLAELATIFHHKLPIKIFLFNNHSHGIQKQTLETWLGGRKVGVDPMSGVAFPANWLEVAKAFGFSTYSIDGTKELPNALDAIYAEEGPAFINVEINPDQKLYPVLKYGEALENQMPLLSEINIEKEMIVQLFKKDINGTSDSNKTSYGW